MTTTPASAALTQTQINDLEIVLTRQFNAPRELVWAAFTEPQHLKEWFGPQGFTNPVVEVDLRPGGKQTIVMHGPTGTEFDKDFPCYGIYREIEPPVRIVYDEIWDDDFKGMVAGLYETGVAPGDGAIVTMEFEPIGTNQTRLTLTTRLPTNADRDALVKAQMADGWGSSFEKLDALLATLA